MQFSKAASDKMKHSSVNMMLSLLLGLLCFIYFFAGTSLYASQSATLPKIEGVWFTCEFATRKGPPDDGCKMFDDEGFAVENGRVTYLRNIASVELACRGNKKGQCFKADTAQITVSERPVGAVEVKDGQLWVSYWGCTQKFDLQVGADYITVIPSKKRCIWARDRHFYVAPFTGKLIRK